MTQQESNPVTTAAASGTAQPTSPTVVNVDAVELAPSKDAVVIIDQTLLPNRLEHIDLQTPKQMYDAIFQLKVRGAPAIGVCAGYCYYVLARQEAQQASSYQDFVARMQQHRDYLNSSRPTAVNLQWALDRMHAVTTSHPDTNLPDLVDLLEAEARAIHSEDVAMSKEISRLGASLLHDGDGVLTHCNAGPLACLGYGTGQGPLFYAHDHGKDVHVFADETRPLLQGARLTSYELQRAGIDVTLICDNMASLVMKNGWVQACMVGCDRVAMNGDAANKIGTSGVAILAAHYGIPFYVLGPTSTIDRNCPTGDDIHIELRDPDEIKTMWYAEPKALPEVKCYNPAFDVTDHNLITAIITEKGICRPPYTQSLAALFSD
ncbi:MAG: S-methyl-5-thioribose-1-phosphate isomerase [Atopobiaceae bacterium]